ncbi:MAG: rhomboid family intramembrane serine protease [Actinobacteria bacterium]|nr:rhomboid family intramembrane serine protease [Actinomycetota bacterium]
MIPLKDYNPTSRRAWVTLGIIIACAAIYFLVQPSGQQVLVQQKDNSGAELKFTFAHAAIPCELVRGRPLTADEVDATLSSGDTNHCDVEPPTQEVFPNKNIYLAVLYSMFLHGSILHLAGNMLFLWIFGNNIEDRAGSIRYLIFYLAAGLAATATFVALDPHGTVPMIGASGAIAGVMGAYLVLFPNVRIRSLIFLGFIVFFRDLQAKWLLVFWFVLQFFTSPSSGVAWTAHVGGFVFGAIVGLIWRMTTKPHLRPSPRPAF